MAHDRTTSLPTTRAITRRTILKTIPVAAAAVTIVGPARLDVSAQETLKVAFVYVGPIGDMGWTYAHDQGRLDLVKAFPNVETSYAENIPENPADAERVIRDFAQKGNQLVITTSFGYMDPTITVAADFPETVFIHISGYKTAENVGTGFGKIEEPRYVSGQIAAGMSPSGKLGYVAAFPIPEVIRGINAFTLGVRKVNPAATVKVVWTSTWFDPAKERQAAEALLSDGADVLAQHQDTAGPSQAAEAEGKFAVGYSSDQASAAPEAVITCPIWHWGVFYSQTVQAVIDGTWATSAYWGGWKDGVVDLSPLAEFVPAEIKTAAEAEIASFKAGEQDIFTVFAGPLKDQTGAEKVAAGTAMTTEELMGMSWFVEGVDGEIPES